MTPAVILSIILIACIFIALLIGLWVYSAAPDDNGLRYEYQQKRNYRK